MPSRFYFRFRPLLAALLLAASCATAQAQTGVGIGTAAPALPLDVAGGLLGLRNGAASWDHLYFWHTGATAVVRAGGAEAGLLFQVGANTATGTYGDASQSYREGLRLLPSGNVGLGIATPGERLEVNGKIKFTTDDDDKLYFTGAGGAAGSKLAHSGGWSLDYYAGPGAGPGTTGQHRFFTTTGGWAERLRIQADGNVGIGTSAPGERLEVSGTAYVNAENSGFVADAGGQRRVGLMKYAGREAGLWRTATQELEIGRVNAPDLTAASGTANTFTTDLYVSGDGRVGVGTSAPAARLDVAGTAAADNITLRNFSPNQATLLAIRGADGTVGQPLTTRSTFNNLPAGSSNSFTWTHNLGFRPVLMLSVETLDTPQSNGFLKSPISHSYRHLDDNRVQVYVYNNDSNLVNTSSFVLHALVVR